MRAQLTLLPTCVTLLLFGLVRFCGVEVDLYIRVVFWEEWINCVENDETYIFNNLRVKEDNYTNEKYVNTAREGFEIEASTPFTQTLAYQKCNLCYST